MRLCSVEGCEKKHDAKGFCRSHYKRWRLHGDPLVVKQRSPGAGWIERKGYIIHTVNGVPVRDHRAIVEKAIGHPLPSRCPVHHVDEDEAHNANNNLVACESYGYHRILHMRMDALKATGHANWMKCPFCHQYDDPKNMRKEKVRYVHASCSAAARTRWLIRREERQNVIHV